MVYYVVHDVNTRYYRGRKLSDATADDVTSNGSSDLSEIHLDQMALMLPDEDTSTASDNNCQLLPRAACRRHSEPSLCSTPPCVAARRPVVPSLALLPRGPERPPSDDADEEDDGPPSPCSDLPSFESRDKAHDDAMLARSLAGLSVAPAAEERRGRMLTLDQFLNGG